jgi:hypothetical protein
MTDISELFSRDPESLTDQDLDAIVKHLQSLRAQFMLGAKTAGTMKKKATKEKVTNINLDELGL